jgi:predicted transcriptional regulator
MTKMLDDAIRKVRELPEAAQDKAAEMLLSVVSKSGAPRPLDDKTRAVIREGREQARHGEFVSDEEMAAFFSQHGVKRHGA